MANIVDPFAENIGTLADPFADSEENHVNLVDPLSPNFLKPTPSLGTLVNPFPDVGPTQTRVIIDTGNAQGKFIIVDATISEGHSFTADVSEYPIEAGSDLTDNVRIKPHTIKMDGVITDTPMDELTIDGQMPQVEAYNNLRQVFAAKQPIVIQTSLDVFDSMIITSLDFPREASNGDALFFSMEAQYAEVLENQRDTVTQHLGGKGSTDLVPQVVKAFSVLSSRRAEFADRFVLLTTDKIPPHVGLKTGPWDHWDVAPIGSFTGGTVAQNDRVRNAAGGSLADGSVNLTTRVYTPFDSTLVAGSRAVNDGQKWVWEKNGKAVPTSPAEAAQKKFEAQSDAGGTKTLDDGTKSRDAWSTVFGKGGISGYLPGK